MKDFIYYRCGGSDGYRFGGERICSNSQVQGGFLETAVWREVSNLLMNPEKIELEHEERSKAGAVLDNLDTLRSQRTKLQHAMERLIDSFTEGLIEKDQFASRMDREPSDASQISTRRSGRMQAMSISGRVSDMRQIVFANWRQPSGQSWPALAGTAGKRSFGHSCSESRLDRIPSVLCFG
jgi:hypothetical protein